MRVHRHQQKKFSFFWKASLARISKTPQQTHRAQNLLKNFPAKIELFAPKDVIKDHDL